MAPSAQTRSDLANLDLMRQIVRMTGQTYATPYSTDVIFVCIDCEAYEHHQPYVTELGVAVLDTRDIAGVLPGENGEGWIAKMRYAHFRPVEYAMKVNRRFVQGAEDRFAFGESTWINLKDAPKILSRIFQCPERLSEASSFAVAFPDTKRNVVLVAHGLSNDDEYLTTLGFNLKQASNLTRHVDTQRIAGGSKKKSIGLRRLLDKLGVQHQGLHNGGNDAAYTLQALIVMAVKDFQQPGVVLGVDELPSITLPGPVRALGASAPHVYGGTAMKGTTELPLNGGKASKPVLKKKYARPEKQEREQRRRDRRAAKVRPRSVLPDLGSRTVKRQASDDPDDQPVTKRPAR